MDQPYERDLAETLRAAATRLNEAMGRRYSPKLSRFGIKADIFAAVMAMFFPSQRFVLSISASAFVYPLF